MRAAFLALLLVNLMFLAWVEWIDVPVSPPNAIAGLPRLRLAAHARSGGPDLSATQATGADSTVSNPAPGAEATGDGGTSAQPTAAPQAVGAPFAAQCVSVGPFDSAAGATQALKQLGGQSLSPKRRVTQSQPTRWYWVYLPSPGSASRANQVLQRLKADGIDGAQPLSTDGKQPISLGMFQDPQLAVHQQHLAQRKGFHPVLADRLVSQPVYWLDLWVPGGAQALPLQALKTGAGSGIGTEACPVGETPPWRAPQEASPGLPAPRASVSAEPPNP